MNETVGKGCFLQLIQIYVSITLEMLGSKKPWAHCVLRLGLVPEMIHHLKTSFFFRFSISFFPLITKINDVLI